ncbi:MAG: hypothetical protein E7668_04045 [Ruminococcaceae bacterium]|nr:hypothetical protein [Oscillospiraceae bacterium]
MVLFSFKKEKSTKKENETKNNLTVAVAFAKNGMFALTSSAFPSGEGGLPSGKTDEEIAVCTAQKLLSSST